MRVMFVFTQHERKRERESSVPRHKPAAQMLTLPLPHSMTLLGHTTNRPLLVKLFGGNLLPTKLVGFACDTSAACLNLITLRGRQLIQYNNNNNQTNKQNCNIYKGKVCPTQNAVFRIFNINISISNTALGAQNKTKSNLH